MIAILNYQAGNVKSLSNALHRQGFKATIISHPNDLKHADLVIIPGVGAFEDAMKALRDANFIDALGQYHLCGKPILGICLGMQLFFESSEEGSNGLVKGLGFMTGHIQRLRPEDSCLKIPHMGWNQLNFSLTPPRFLANNAQKPLQAFDGKNVYFIHSYGLTAANPEDILYTTVHGQTIPALVYKPASQNFPTSGALIGFQFHPEKSGPLGEQLLSDAIQLLLNTR